MGVDMPANAVDSVLKEQSEWEKKREIKSSKEYLYKRYELGGGLNIYKSLYSGTWQRKLRRLAMSKRRFTWRP